MAKPKFTVGWIVLAGSCIAAGLAAAACGNGDPAISSNNTTTGPPGEGACATPTAGCACTTEGKTAACGSVISHEGNHVECSEGTTTCRLGKWGVCVGETTHMATLAASGGLGVKNLSPAPGACAGSPCDPYCNTYNDTPPGFDAGSGSGITVTDAGVTLVGTVIHTTACTGLTVSPATETLTVTQIPASGSIVYTGSPSAAPLTYTDALVPSTCYSGAPPSVWTVDDPSIATISTGGTVQLVSPVATSFHVIAYSGGWSNSATPALVNVIVNAVDVSSAPSGYTNASFSGSPSTSDNITVLYPYNNTVLPLGLPAPVIQWSNGGTSANAVRVQLRYPAGSGSSFTWSGILPENQTQPTPSLPGQPRAFPPQSVWTAFEQTASGHTADIVIQRIVGGTLLKPNPPVTITFATGQLKGTVYYQSYGTNLVSNYCCTESGANFGGATLAVQPGAPAPIVAAGSNSQCVVCHSVASGGSNLVTQNGGNYTQSFEYNLTTSAVTTMAPADGRFAWPALSSDGSYLFSNSGPQPGGTTSVASSLYTVPGGSAIAATGLPSINALSPSFSSDNAHVAFNFYGGTASGHTADAASLASIDYAFATKAFSNFQVLATPGSGGVGSAGSHIYYPSYLPSNNQLVWELETVYNGRDVAGTRSQCDQAGPVACQNDGTHAELWWTDVASKTSAKMVNLNGGSYLPPHAAALLPNGDNQLNYEPTVNPQTTGGFAWVVFTSRREYGNIATVNPFWSDPRFENIGVQPTTKKLWVSAINPSAAPGTDPSYPAFYLPGQELLAGNARGYWVLSQCEAAGPPTPANLCNSNLDCCPAPLPTDPPVVCSLDAPPATTKHCTSAPSTSCSIDGAACTASDQCCNFPASVCAQSVCKPAQTVLFSPSQFSTVYDGTMCGPGTRVSWIDVGLEALTPSSGGTNTSIAISVQAGNTSTVFTPSSPVAVGTLTGPPANQSATWNNFPLSPALATISGVAETDLYLRLTLVLTPSADMAVAPTIVDWRVRFDCAPSE
jgi:hypothetical protein